MAAAGLAQLVERQFCKLDVAGSIPAAGTTAPLRKSGRREPDAAGRNAQPRPHRRGPDLTSAHLRSRRGSHRDSLCGLVVPLPRYGPATPAGSLAGPVPGLSGPWRWGSAPWAQSQAAATPHERESRRTRCREVQAAHASRAGLISPVLALSRQRTRQLSGSRERVLRQRASCRTDGTDPTGAVLTNKIHVDTTKVSAATA